MINIRSNTGFNTDAAPPSAAHLLKTPSTPVMPIPSTMSRDSLKGTVSGVGRIFPCSKATPDQRRTRKKNKDSGGVDRSSTQSRRRTFCSPIGPESRDAVPKSMCTSSAVCSSIRMFWMCLSPRPTMYPTVANKTQTTVHIEIRRQKRKKTLRPLSKLVKLVVRHPERRTTSSVFSLFPQTQPQHTKTKMTEKTSAFLTLRAVLCDAAGRLRFS